MESVILVIHLIIAVAIIAIIMIQPSEAGGFLGTGSMANAMAPRRRGDALSRATTILAGCFFVTSLVLALLASHRPASTSILDVAGDDVPAVTDTADKTAEPKTAQELTNESAEKIADKPAAEPTEAKKSEAKKPASKTPKAPLAK